MNYMIATDMSNYLCHHGVKGQKWGVRRYQNPDGTLTEEGKKRYGTVENFNKAQKRKKIAIGVGAGVGGALTIGAAVVLGKRRIENLRLQKSMNEAVDNLDRDISADKEMISHYIRELNEANKDVKLSKKVNLDKLSKESSRHGTNAMTKFAKAGENEDFGRGLLYGARMTDWDALEYEARKLNASPEHSNRRDSVARNLYESNREQEKSQRAYDLKRRLETAENRRLDASLNVKGYVDQLDADRKERRGYADAAAYYKKHPLATKMPRK